MISRTAAKATSTALRRKPILKDLNEDWYVRNGNSKGA
jgi:hypothetical protein